MAIIRVATDIAAAPTACFDLARSVDAHIGSTAGTGERAVGGVTAGLLGLGDEVTWRARHFGISQELTSRITATVTENPAVIIVTTVGTLVAFTIVLTASLAGFWEGWRAGWGFAMGQSISASLRTGPLSRLTVWARRRIRPRTGSADSAA